MMEWWWIGTLLLCAVLCALGSGDPPAPSNDGMTPVEALKVCTPWGNVEIFIKNKNGTFSHVKHIPHDLLCTFDPSSCILDKNGRITMNDAQYKNMTLSTVGLYGLSSLRSPQFARLLMFRTKVNHSDDSEYHMSHGCYGTVHPSLIPKEPWLAFIKRGECYFTEKLENAVDTHGAAGFVMYNHDDSVPKVIMNLTVTDLTTIMINNSIGTNIERLDTFLTFLEMHFPNHTLPYTRQLYTNISFSHCAKKGHIVKNTPIAVTAVTITFVVIMIIALAWLVICYFQKHRSANKQTILQMKFQKAAKKALKKIGERVISELDEEADEQYQQDCTYCLELLLIGETIRQLPCRHKFHKDCIDDWLIHNRTCPNCGCNILVATGVTIRGLRKTVDENEDEPISTEMTDMATESGRGLLSDSQPIAGHTEEFNSQCWGSQVIPGSQLLTDGQNMFLYVPNDVDLPPDSTIQIEAPPPQLQLSQLRLIEEKNELLADQQPSDQPK